MRDLRLALPVAIAWAVLAVLSAQAALLGVAAVVAAACAMIAGWMRMVGHVTPVPIGI